MHEQKYVRSVFSVLIVQIGYDITSKISSCYRHSSPLTHTNISIWPVLFFPVTKWRCGKHGDSPQGQKYHHIKAAMRLEWGKGAWCEQNGIQISFLTTRQSQRRGLGLCLMTTSTRCGGNTSMALNAVTCARHDNGLKSPDVKTPPMTTQRARAQTQPQLGLKPIMGFRARG